MKKGIVVSSVLLVLLLCSCRHINNAEQAPSGDTPTERQDTTGAALKADNQEVDSMPSSVVADSVAVSKITPEMALEGVTNYCHDAYDWSVAEENPSMMYVSMGEETATEYQVIFRSYTGAFVYFYVSKTTGTARMVEHVPSLEIENEIGTIDIKDYLKK